MTDTKLCMSCRKVRPITRFESRGWRNGKQRRRHICADCYRALRPYRLPNRPQDYETGTRPCAVCGVVKPLEAYRYHGERPAHVNEHPYYRERICRACVKALHRALMRGSALPARQTEYRTDRV